MQRTTWAAGLGLILAAVPAGRAGDDDTFDLRGPAPQKGQVFVAKGFFKIKDAKSVLKADDNVIRSKVSETTTTEYEITVLAVEGRQITKVKTRLVKDATETVDTTDGETNTDTEPSPLEGETVLGEFGGTRKWTNTLAGGGKPDDKQRKKLAEFTGPENDDALYPEGKVKVGHTWDAEGSALVNYFDLSFSNIKGKLKQTFVRVEDVDGEPCAVVETTGTLTAKAKTDEGVLDLTMDLTKRTVWRSLKTGVDVRDRSTGRLKYAGKLEVDGQKVDYTLEGPFESGGTTKLK